MRKDTYMGGGPGLGAYFPGLMMILFGMLIFISPRLLEFLVAIFFVSAGVTALFIGHAIRRGRKNSSQIFVQWMGNDRIDGDM